MRKSCSRTTLWTLGIVFAIHGGGLARAGVVHPWNSASIARPVAAMYVPVRGSTRAPTALERTVGHAVPVALRPHETSSSWPWLALGGIAAILAVISLAARRRLPFGSRF